MTVSIRVARQIPQEGQMANKAIIRNAYGEPAMFAGSKTGSDDAAFVFVRVGDEERRMRWAEWDALPAWSGPRPSWGPKSTHAKSGSEPT
jgi:hypothetical protein